MHISLYQILFEQATSTDTAGSTGNKEQKVELELPQDVKKTIDDTNKKVARVQQLQVQSIAQAAKEKGENAQVPQPPGSKAPSSGSATAPTGGRSPKKSVPSGTPTIPQTSSSSTSSSSSSSSSSEPVTHNDLETMKKELLGAIEKK